MISIELATHQDVLSIHLLANEIWWPTYEAVLTKNQIQFMLKKGYSEQALTEQMDEGVIFLLAKRENANVAFAGYSLDLNEAVCKLHKLYILPSEQGKGTGKKLIQYVSEQSEQRGAEILELNVNRNNPALGFYKATGFEIFKEVDIPYHGFVLNDFVLRKPLKF